MTKAFVFGKFLPFHKGHQAMINFALTKCDFLTVLVCCSDKENISGPLRQKWIEKTFETLENIEVKIFYYSENELPNTSESSLEVSRVWSEIFKTILGDYHLVITSEPYGDYVAEFMGIKHICFDKTRELFPISATALRNDIFSNWNFLPNKVKPNFAIKIVILGTESTGKSTLAQQLATHFSCSLVKEVARELIADSNSFAFDDLHLVASRHAKEIDRAVLLQSPLIIIDTDIHITKSYARFIFDKTLEVSDEIYQSNKADLYLYLNNQVQYFQDGTRLQHSGRNLLDASHRQVLQDHNINFTEITGNWQQRFEQATTAINRILQRKNI